MVLQEFDYGFRNLSSFLPEEATRNPERIALIWEDKNITYGELLKHTSQIASSLKNLGVKKGGRVGCLMKNSSEMVYVWLGSLMAG